MLVFAQAGLQLHASLHCLVTLCSWVLLRFPAVAAKPAASLPSTMSGLQHLWVLSLRGNQLPALPPALGSCSQLEELDVRDNQLAALPAELGQLSSLKALFADNNRWGGPSAPGGPLLSTPEEGMGKCTVGESILSRRAAQDTLRGADVCWPASRYICWPVLQLAVCNCCLSQPSCCGLLQAAHGAPRAAERVPRTRHAVSARQPADGRGASGGARVAAV